MSLTPELEHFYKHQPETVRTIRTIELYHPDIGVHRYCEPYSDKSLTLEAGAPRNASQAVTFTAASVEIGEPSEGANRTSSFTASFPMAGTQISEIMDQITDYLIPIEFIYRKYLSTVLTEPAQTPSYVYVSAIAFDGDKNVTISAATDNGSIRRTGSIYTLEKYPSLKNL